MNYQNNAASRGGAGGYSAQNGGGGSFYRGRGSFFRGRGYYRGGSNFRGGYRGWNNRGGRGWYNSRGRGRGFYGGSQSNNQQTLTSMAGNQREDDEEGNDQFQDEGDHSYGQEGNEEEDDYGQEFFHQEGENLQGQPDKKRKYSEDRNEGTNSEDKQLAVINANKRFRLNYDMSAKTEDNEAINLNNMAQQDEDSLQEIASLDDQSHLKKQSLMVKPQRRVQFQGLDQCDDAASDSTSSSQMGNGQNKMTSQQSFVQPNYSEFGKTKTEDVNDNTYTKKGFVYCHGLGYAKPIDQLLKKEGFQSPSKSGNFGGPPQDRAQGQLPFNSTVSVRDTTPNSSQNQGASNKPSQQSNQSASFGQIKQDTRSQYQPPNRQQQQVAIPPTITGKHPTQNNQNKMTLNEYQKIGKELYEMHLETMKERNHIMQQIRCTLEFKNLPWFLQPDKILDAKGNRPDHQFYDPSSVLIPQNEMLKFSPFLQQYWKIKQTHFDKILCFQKGKFYELYYIDALIGHYFLKISWSGGANPINYIQAIQVGIHEKNLNKACQELIDIGFKVAVIEQVEEKQDVDKRIRNQNTNWKYHNMMQKTPEQLVKREMSGIYTRGIQPYDPTSTDYETKWIMALYVEPRQSAAHSHHDNFQKNDVIGIAFFDNTTLQLHLGQFDEDILYSKMRTLLCQIRPIEIIYDRDSISLDVVKILKEQPLTPDLNSISLSKNSVDPHSGIKTALDLFGQDDTQWPQILQKYRTSINEFGPTWICYAMLMMYLKTRLIDDQILKLTEFHAYDPYNQLKSHMEIDAQAIRHLDLLEVQGHEKPKVEGSLLHYLDYTKTVFGKRLLKKWISSPLYDIEKINSRLDAVSDFMKHNDLLFKFQEKLKLLPDFEKECTNIYKLSTRSSMSLLTFEKLDIDCLRDFFNLLEKIKFVNQILAIFKTAKETFKSSRLKALLTMKEPNKKAAKVKSDKGGNMKGEDVKMIREKLEAPGANKLALFPEINNAIAEFEALIIWTTGPSGEKIPEPFEGFDTDYDTAKKRVQDIERKLDNHLQEVRDMFGYKTTKEIKFAHSTHQRYMLEIPKVLVDGGKRPPDFELVRTSSAQVNLKFITSKIRTYVAELEDAEYNMKVAIMPFICSIFDIFRQKKRVWSQIVACLAELDCLASLATVSQSSDGLTCRPQFIKSEDNFYKPYMELKKMKHPCVNLTMSPEVNQTSALGFSDEPIFKTSQFIPNDIVIGRLEPQNQHLSSFSEADHKHPTIMLLTGPNMGGKSTLLRQTCLAAIIAQMGCYIPAEKCVLTPVDKIFTRLGSSDKLLEKKSTFYVEMEETKSILDKATQNSLAVIDELGRGTSTYDGLSIADAVLQHIADKIGCRCLFATHYHQLCSKYEDHPLIQNASMTYSLDIKNQKITYLFQLRKEKCGRSFGINVAQIVGLPERIIELAKLKSIELEKSLESVYQRYLEHKSSLQLKHFSGLNKQRQIQEESKGNRVIGQNQGAFEQNKKQGNLSSAQVLVKESNSPEKPLKKQSQLNQGGSDHQMSTQISSSTSNSHQSTPLQSNLNRKNNLSNQQYKSESNQFK